MAIYKNKASQKIAVYAHDTSADEPKTGDAANITAQISLDGAATAATDDTTPTELDATDAKGIYIFDMTQDETNADLIILSAVSSTSNISIEPLIIYTEPELRTANITQISDDATAASNLELALENGTAGYVASDLKYLDGTAQRATDLAEIAQYLIANSATLTSVMADDSILAKLMATDGDISEFDEATDSLQSIANAEVNATWTDAEKANIRYQIGVDGTATKPSTNKQHIVKATRSYLRK